MSLGPKSALTKPFLACDGHKKCDLIMILKTGAFLQVFSKPMNTTQANNDCDSAVEYLDQGIFQVD